jgi:hypothetical protein
MGNVVNLNRFRKDKAREEKTAQAAENRTAHGRSKTEKTVEKIRADKAKKELDQHLREPDPDDGPGVA